MKKRTVFVCQNCGYESPKWLGKCPSCGEWNTFVEEKPTGKKSIPVIPFASGKKEGYKERINTGIYEFDRVLGGGIVKGSLTLLGGDPGIGKSTLLLTIAGLLSEKGIPVLYVSGEESISQVNMRAERLGVNTDNLFFLPETEIEGIIKGVSVSDPGFLIIDSIQTIYAGYLESPPGSISQVRECTSRIMREIKGKGITTFIIGHITKSGAIAGPKTLEHMVDTVLYLEGDTNHIFRILRGVKNRFGSINEIGIFEMTGKGLIPVENPSKFLLSGGEWASGNTIVPTTQGTRPLLVEVQSLLIPARFNYPQRVSTGIDYRRLNMLIAITEKRLGLGIGGYDIFCNITGGLKVDEPAIDLGIIFSMVSGFIDKPIDRDTALAGEVGLGGEVRAIPFIDMRVKECKRLGLSRIIIPDQRTEGIDGIEVVKVRNIQEAKEALF